MPDEDCLVCGEVDGRVPVPGGALLETPRVVAFHAPVLDGGSLVYAGHLFVCPKRHAASFADLTDAEARDVGWAIARASAALRAAGAARVYVATIGHGVDHLHVHLAPRWPETPDGVRWHEVDEWPGARRVDHDGARALAASLKGALAGADPAPPMG